jgi:hypothetical protein
MKLFRKITLLGLLCMFSFSAIAADDMQKSAFYSALSMTSTTLANDTFMLDQYLETRCEKHQSIEYLKTLGRTQRYIVLALKDDKFSEAKVLLASIPCDPALNTSR